MALYKRIKRCNCCKQLGNPLVISDICKFCVAGIIKYFEKVEPIALDEAIADVRKQLPKENKL